MAVVFNRDPVALDFDPACVRVGVVGVLDELCHGDVGAPDEPLAKLAQQRRVNRELRFIHDRHAVVWWAGPAHSCQPVSVA